MLNCYTTLSNLLFSQLNKVHVTVRTSVSMVLSGSVRPISASSQCNSLLWTCNLSKLKFYFQPQIITETWLFSHKINKHLLSCFALWAHSSYLASIMSWSSAPFLPLVLVNRLFLGNFFFLPPIFSCVIIWIIVAFTSVLYWRKNCYKSLKNN